MPREAGPFPRDGRLYGDVVAKGNQFAITLSPHGTEESRKDFRMAHLWTEDDENWFHVYAFDAFWVKDLMAVVSKTNDNSQVGAAYWAVINARRKQR